VPVRVLFFGVLRDIVGRSEDLFDAPAETPLAAIFEHYAARHPRLREQSRSVAVARNQSFAPWSDLAASGDEVAFMPPVSGGVSRYSHEAVDEATGDFAALTRQTIDRADLTRRVLRPEDGAVVDFIGVVRNNSGGRRTRFLDYECYEPMAIKVLAEIGRRLRASYPLGRIALVHRLGRLEIGDASVAVVVSAPHRKPAFEAALEGINRIKKLVPVWKKEYFEDGEIWVEGEWDDSVLAR
jgi:MoaE-MoaD fusion protein